MSIIFYNCTAEPNRVDKSAYLQPILVIGAYNLLENSNNHSPSFRVESSINILHANYCYWEESNRYYYVTVTSENSGIYMIQGVVDPLHTYRSQIKSSIAIAERCDTQNNYLMDNAVAVQSDRTWEYLMFPGKLNNNLQNVLIVAGG